MSYAVIAILLLLNVVLAGLLFRNRHVKKEGNGDSGKVKPPTQRKLLEELKALLDTLDNPDTYRKWGDAACLLLQQGFEANSVFILQAGSTGKHERCHRIAWGGGEYAWCVPKPGEVVTFDSEIGKHFFWSTQAQILSENHLADCLPSERGRVYSSALAGIFEINRHRSFLVLLRDHDAAPYETQDKQKFEICFQIVKAGFTLIGLHDRTIDLEMEIHRAHEEGMLQISTGIIHNIGNGIAVIKIALDRLKDFRSVTELTRFLNEEMVPAVIQLETDTAQADSRRLGYLEGIREITGKLDSFMGEHAKELEFISDKFQNVIEIITLQQQFIGELGTENIVPFRLILADVVKMSETPVRESDIEFRRDIETEEQVLVDPALLKQVFLTIIKYSVHSINKIHRTPSVLELHCRDSVSEQNNRKVIRIEIRDNGYGIPFDPEASFQDHSQSAQEHRELLFCKGKIEKYRGTFEIETRLGTGSTVYIEFPAYDPEKDDASKMG
jgi:signal transduction histidine kinase